jgi:hypothetical protein
MPASNAVLGIIEARVAARAGADRRGTKAHRDHTIWPISSVLE